MIGEPCLWSSGLRSCIVGLQEIAREASRRDKWQHERADIASERSAREPWAFLARGADMDKGVRAFACIISDAGWLA